jgi:subtilisin family serine protease
VTLAAPFENYAPRAGNDYSTVCGTSIAAPFVSGVAALLWKANPAWSNQRLVEHLIATSLDRPPAGWDDSTGYGIVRASLADVFAPPSITASIQITKPKLTWSAVPAATSYRIYRRVNPDIPQWTLVATTTTTSYTDGGFQATSFDGYNTNPTQPSAGYYVVAVAANGYQSQIYSAHATFLGQLLQ